MINCPECGSPFVQTDGVTLRTLVGFSSPPGHNHDDNCAKRLYVCAQGHQVVVSKRNRCPACDWVGRDYCFCHEGKKVDEWPEINTEGAKYV